MFKISNVQRSRRGIARQCCVPYVSFIYTLLRQGLILSHLKAENRLASHYGRNDAREVRRRERSEDLSVTVPFNSWLDSTMWYLVGLLCLGPPFGYLKRINNVVRIKRSSTFLSPDDPITGPDDNG